MHVVFVFVLLMIFLTVLELYRLGDFNGLSIGEDFGLVLAVPLIIGLCIGMVTALFVHRR